MKEATQRGLDNSIKLMFESPEFDRIRLFFVAAVDDPTTSDEELVKYITDATRSHLVTHGKAVRAIAASKRRV